MTQRAILSEQRTLVYRHSFIIPGFLRVFNITCQGDEVVDRFALSHLPDAFIPNRCSCVMSSCGKEGPTDRGREQNMLW